jgi:ligand-binding SRPBCC domain-containing protein
MRYRLQRSQQLHCDIKTAWSFFSSPQNLSRITPPEMRFRVLPGAHGEDLFEGMMIDYSVSPLLGIPVKWTTRITQVDDQKSFTDYQHKGPYTLWNHFHEFIPNESGVLMKDTVDYELPFGMIGEIVHALVVRKKLNRIFDYRHQVLEELINKQKITT